jgi:hypothetical protein
MSRRRTRDETAELIWEALVSAGPEGLSRQDIKDELGLTEMQFHYGLGLIRDLLQRRYGQPIAYNPQTYCYSLPETWDGDKPWVMWRGASLLTQIRRVEENVLAAASLYGENVPGLRRISRDLSRLREDLQDIVVAVSHSNNGINP